MKNKYLLVPIPIFLLSVWYFATIALNDIPFWYKGMSDPSYLYLESTLHVARGEFPVHVDNPGTPVQYIGAITFRLTHLLAGKGDFTEDVLTRSEYYLRVLRFVLLFMAVISIFLGGFLAFKITENYFSVFVVQIAPFLTDSILKTIALQDIHRLQTVCPEVFFIPLGIAWLICLLYLEKRDFTISKKQEILLLTLLTTSIASTKLTLLPFVLFPLLLKSTVRVKFMYVGLFLLSFVLFNFFQLFSSEKLFLWTRDLFFASGTYGTGERNFINIQDFTNNAVDLVKNEPLFVLSLLINGFLLLFLDKNSSYFRAMMAVWIVEMVYWVMLTKNYANRYYVYGALFLVAGSFWLIYRAFYNTKLKKGLSIAILGMILLVLAKHFLKFIESQEVVKYHKERTKQVQNFYEKYPKTYSIVSYDAISQSYALSYGIFTFSPGLKSNLGKYLKDKYPYTIYDNLGHYTFWGEDVSLDSLLNKQDKILWHTGIYGADNEIKRIMGGFKDFRLVDSLPNVGMYVFSKVEH